MFGCPIDQFKVARFWIDGDGMQRSSHGFDHVNMGYFAWLRCSKAGGFPTSDA